MHLLLALGLAGLFGCADRLAGGDYVAWVQARAKIALANLKPAWLASTLLAIVNARSVMWAALALTAILLAATHDPRWALIALAWTAWRWDGWGVFGGGIDPKTPAEDWGYFERHLMAAPLAIVLHYAFAVIWPFAIVGVVMFAIFATLLGMILAKVEASQPGANAKIEFARGAIYGLVVWALAAG